MYSCGSVSGPENLNKTDTNMSGVLLMITVKGRKWFLFNDVLNTFYLRLYGVRHMVNDHSDSEKGRKEGNVLFNTFYLRLYGVRHMVKDHSDSERGNPLSHMDYSFRLTARVLLYAQDNTYHSLCYTSRGALAGTRIKVKGCFA